MQARNAAQEAGLADAWTCLTRTFAEIEYRAHTWLPEDIATSH